MATAETMPPAAESEPDPRPPVGLHRNIPFDTYAAWPALNHSVLRHFRRSAAHARHAMLHGVEPTVAMDLGRAVHVAILEPERFDAEYATAPHCDRRTKAGKATYATWAADTQGRIAITAEEARLCAALRAAVDQYETARGLLRCAGTSELSVVADFDDVRVKGRLDRVAHPTMPELAGYVWIVDVKTAPDASPAWKRDVHNYSYANAAAWYLDLVDTVAPGPERRFAWVVLEKVPPYAVAVYEPDLGVLDQAREENAEYLDRYRACVKSGRWPGYIDGVVPLGLPAWAMKRRSE